MALIKDQTATYDQLAVIHKYEAVIDYLYPIFQNCPRKQSVVRARRKLNRLRATGDLDALRSFVGAWSGHARWADAHHLMVDLKLRRLA